MVGVRAGWRQRPYDIDKRETAHGKECLQHRLADFLQRRVSACLPASLPACICLAVWLPPSDFLFQSICLSRPACQPPSCPPACRSPAPLPLSCFLPLFPASLSPVFFCP